MTPGSQAKDRQAGCDRAVQEDHRLPHRHQQGNRKADDGGRPEVIIVPQGTLIEQIRCAGYGLGGVLTATGLGTEVEKGKDKIMVDGKEYLVEKPLRADVALIFANTVDKYGNMNFHGATRNLNHMMASAADITIVQADKIVEIGDLDPDTVHTPGVFVNYIVDGGKK